MKKTFLIIVIILGAALTAAIPAFADPPPASGPIIVRTQETGAFHYFDARTGLGIIVGADVSEFCSGVVDFDPVNVQNIDVPSDANRLVQTYESDAVTVSVWPFPQFDCDLFTTSDPVASGTVSLQGADNDVYPGNSSGENWNAWGFAAHGQLSQSDGSSAQLSTLLRCTWDGETGASNVCVTNVNLID
ncbi:MAG: hypothetical protein PVH18_10605 [Chloroflexota bacterium]|jgi:hypothetical protein